MEEKIKKDEGKGETGGTISRNSRRLMNGVKVEDSMFDSQRINPPNDLVGGLSQKKVR